MTTADVIQKIETSRPKKIKKLDLKHKNRLFLTIRPDHLTGITRFLFDELGCRFVIASAMQTKAGFEIYYHFSVDAVGLMINVHVVLPEKNPEIESLANISTATNWIEREMHELYGINFLNHPNLEKLISEDLWEEGVYPYRNN